MFENAFYYSNAFIETLTKNYRPRDVWFFITNNSNNSCDSLLLDLMSLPRVQTSNQRTHFGCNANINSQQTDYLCEKKVAFHKTRYYIIQEWMKNLYLLMKTCSSFETCRFSHIALDFSYFNTHDWIFYIWDGVNHHHHFYPFSLSCQLLKDEVDEVFCCNLDQKRQFILSCLPPCIRIVMTWLFWLFEKRALASVSWIRLTDEEEFLKKRLTFCKW